MADTKGRDGRLTPRAEQSSLEIYLIHVRLYIPAPFLGQKGHFTEMCH